MSKQKEKNKGLLTQQQFLAVFAVEPGMLIRWIKFGMPVIIEGNQKFFDLLQVGQWIVQHLSAGYLTLEQTAEMFAVEVRTITKWKNDIGMPQSTPGFYKRNDVIQWREKYLSKKIKLLETGGTDGMSQSTRLKRVQSQRQELRLQKEAGNLVEIDKVIPVFEKIYSLMAQRRKLFSKRVNPQLDGIDSFGEREKILNDNIDGIFTDIYNTGIRELNRLREFSGTNGGDMENNSAAQKTSSKRARKRKKNSKPGNK
jgi:phage terminase Nu1 subunit (DNA packaging protein)